MKSKLKRQSVLDEGCCPNPKQPGPQGAAILLLLSFLTSSIFSPLLSLNSQNGGMEGALVGAASGAATAYARQFGVNVGVSYSYSGGFGGTVGLGSSKLNAGVTFSQHGSTSFNVGGSYGNVSYNPQSGFSGSVNLTPGQNTGVMVNVAQHSGPSLTVQESNEASGIGGSVTIDGKGNTTVAATYRNATVVSATGNVHDPSSFGNLKGNENFNSDLNQNLAMGKADENLKAGTAELAAGRSKIAETGNEAQREILNNENASAQDQHGVLATLASAGDFLTDPSSASTWLGRTAQDVVGSFLGSTGLGASDSNGFIDKDGNYRQRTCFTAETLIRTKNGLKRIDQIQVGDFVLSINENTGKVSYKRVTQLFVHDVGLIHRVTYENGSTLNTTWNHPFYLRSTGWTEVKDIRLNERSVTIASIRTSEKAKVASNSGILLGASLASLNRQTSNQEYSNSWKNEYRGTLGITKVEEVYTNTKVYNFEVEDNHTYFVGKDGVLVHNYLPEFADQINQRVTEIKGAINDPVGTAKAVAENQFSKEGLQRTAIDALTLGQGRNIENLVNATGVNGEEAAARAHANFVFDGVLGVATEGVGKVLSSIRGLRGGTQEVSAGSKAAVAGENSTKLENSIAKVTSKEGTFQYDLSKGIDTGQPVKFGQKGVSPDFSKAGKHEGASIDEVAARLKSGDINPRNFKVEYIWVNGEKVAVNNRSLTAATKAEVLDKIKYEDVTGILPETGPDSLSSVLKRLNEMNGKPSRTIPIRQTGDWNSPAKEIVGK